MHQCDQLSVSWGSLVGTMNESGHSATRGRKFGARHHAGCLVMAMARDSVVAILFKCQQALALLWQIFRGHGIPKSLFL